MAITHEVLGEPGRDNALLVTIDSGQSQHRLLFDSGEGCLAKIAISQIQAIEAVFFSHFHIDHVAGFDSFLRMNWARPDTPVRIFGPPGAIKIVHYRLRGYPQRQALFKMEKSHAALSCSDAISPLRIVAACSVPGWPLFGPP